MPARALHSQPDVAIMSHKQTGFAKATDLSVRWRELPGVALKGRNSLACLIIASVRLLYFVSDIVFFFCKSISKSSKMSPDPTSPPPPLPTRAATAPGLPTRTNPKASEST